MTTSCHGGGTCNRSGIALPVLDYANPADGCAVTGGYVYRGNAIPAIQGVYFYSDYCHGWVRSFKYTAGSATDPHSWPALAIGPGPGVPSFGEDGVGELYILTGGGSVYRIVASP